ncbi:MAG TPA: lysophospholipid acyltransferase family protein, partial [Kofleriaceae bacterium]|nr:lysophospholipid acyltransferase family protein [Kofleriaceae bacterium]
MFYRVLQWLLRIASRVFFRRIEIVGLGNIPQDGAVLFCGNHPNSLIDPILITAHCGRRVHFAAKDTLFDSPLLGRLLRAMGAVPVRRKMDHPGGALDNESAFAALHQVLLDGGAVGIFPEGISHLDSQLAPLKTGAARIALEVARKPGAQPVRIIPTGLVYLTRHRFRSSVLIQFGAPLVVGA